MYAVRTRSASAYSHRREVERLCGNPMGMRERVMQVTERVTILTAPRILVFNKTRLSLIEGLRRMRCLLVRAWATTTRPALEYGKCTDVHVGVEHSPHSLLVPDYDRLVT